MQYLFVYLGVGLFLAASALLHRQYTRDKKYVAAFFTVFLWPLVLLLAPESIFRSSPEENDYISTKDPLNEKIKEILQTNVVYLSEQEKVRLTRIAQYGQSFISFFSYRDNFEDILSKFWDEHIPPEIYYDYIGAVYHLDENYEPVHYSASSNQHKTTEWYIGFSNEFVKSISKVDRKKQGRILEAISKIAVSPVEVVGDTIKPLTADLSGLWRFRLGDDRLVYFPDTQSQKVVLISFSSRGEVYK